MKKIIHKNSNNPTQSNSTITLKGRKKRNPMNINYNELFVNQNEQDHLPKKKKEKKEATQNIDAFVERVKEKNEFEKIFNSDSVVISCPPKENIFITANDHQDLIFFENANIKKDELPRKQNENEKALNTNIRGTGTSTNHFIKKEIPIISIPTPIKEDGKIKLRKDDDSILNQKEVEVNEDNDNEQSDISIRLEEKMRNNSDLYYLTPLYKIRRNTESKKKPSE
jgi:hypothetical protein